ncbi:hypothetical protein EJD97_007490 [Solanum chilense]|uniref:Uncharacterized protein n=1 Tax=Solanum chilense TaxID=4083 RepID=A0A6N2AHC3_SOLCI|nr:hypothetical protein EJD97_007490 [Solanum chilense]
MEQGMQHVDILNKPVSGQAHNKGSNNKRDHRNTQQRKDNQEPRFEQTDYQQVNTSRSGIDSMLPLPTSLNIVNNAGISIVDNSAGVAVGGLDGSGQEKDSCNQARISKGKGKIGEHGSLNDKVPPDRTNSNKIQHTINKSNIPTVSNPGNDPSIHQSNIDEYKEPDSEDEYEDDTQPLGEGRDTGEGIGTSYQFQKGPLLQTSNVEDIRDVADKQGLSPRGRKILKQNPNTSIRKPNTRARSRGF